MKEEGADRCVDGSWPVDALQRLAYAAMRVLGRVRVAGAEQLPATGPLLLAMNHRAMLDGPLLCGLLERPVCCLVKAEAFRPVVGQLLVWSGQLAVVRGTIDPAPVRRCLEILLAGGVVGIFPEGSRGDGQVHQARPGVGYLALRSGATVVPIACHGSHRLGREPRRVRVAISIGTPIGFDAWPVDRILPRREVAFAAEAIRVRLAALVAATAPGTGTATGTLAG